MMAMMRTMIAIEMMSGGSDRVFEGVSERKIGKNGPKKVYPSLPKFTLVDDKSVLSALCPHRSPRAKVPSAIPPYANENEGFLWFRGRCFVDLKAQVKSSGTTGPRPYLRFSSGKVCFWCFSNSFSGRDPRALLNHPLIAHAAAGVSIRLVLRDGPRRLSLRLHARPLTIKRIFL